MGKRVVIVGGGPSGLIAGSSATIEGYDVEIYEEHRNIGLPERCGGLLSSIAIDWFKNLGIEVKGSILNKIDRAKISCGNSTIIAKVNAYVIDRKKFDQSCLSFSEKNGVKINLGKKLNEDDLLKLKNSSYIIGADGPLSLVAKTFKFPEIKYAIAYQCDTSIERDFDKNRFEAFFFKNSFGWIIPKNEEEARVGILFYKEPSFKKFERFAKNFGKIVRSTLFSDVIPASPRKHIQKENVYLVGDAAGQVKATSGGGIYYGCLSAWLAGKTIKSRDYEKRWKEKIGRKLFYHSAARLILNRMFLTYPLITALNFLEKFNLRISYDMENINSLHLDVNL